ncbi:MAG: hypothetical protein RBT60_01830 [Candidatus Krumholzibacteria bacterium]|jgi:hypothetical protein|nr:hypothetical protein [Candidatus Krumholzibacteria bacterium]
MAFGDLARVAGDGDLEHGLCQVDGDRGMLHLGLLLPRMGARVRGDFGTLAMPVKSREESIPSFKLVMTVQPGFGLVEVEMIAHR